MRLRREQVCRRAWRRCRARPRRERAGGRRRGRRPRAAARVRTMQLAAGRGVDDGLSLVGWSCVGLGVGVGSRVEPAAGGRSLDAGRGDALDEAALEDEEDQQDRDDDDGGAGEEQAVVRGVLARGVERQGDRQGVVSSVWATTSGQRKLFQLPRKVRIPSVASAGPHSGRMIRAKMRSSPAPSTRPASSRSRGQAEDELPHEEDPERRRRGTAGTGPAGCRRARRSRRARTAARR